MSAGEAQARAQRAQHNPLRLVQQARAVAKCITIAIDGGEEIDVADAIAGLVLLLDMAAAALDQPRGAS